MNRLSQRQAASLWNVSRIKIQRAIKDGKLTPVGGKLDPTDLIRVLGEPPKPKENGSVEPGGTASSQAEKAAAEARIARLEAEVDGLRALVAAKEETIAAMRLLTHDQAPRKRRWWQL